eukprot:jgi/Orpsp1_1/1192532/evm.model.d7180000094042.1
MDIDEEHNENNEINKENQTESVNINQNLNKNVENCQKDKINCSQISQSPNTGSQDKLLNSDKIEAENIEEKKPRLVMTKMVLVNFKSYCGRIEIGPFHK